MNFWNDLPKMKTIAIGFFCKWCLIADPTSTGIGAGGRKSTEWASWGKSAFDGWQPIHTMPFVWNTWNAEKWD